MILALRAAAVSTRAGAPYGMATVSALNEQLTGIGCPASADGIDGAQMTGQKAGAVFGLKGIVVLIQDQGKLHDHNLLKSTWRVLISSLIVSNAFCSAVSVKWA
jgi:hypothetical protein